MLILFCFILSFLGGGDWSLFCCAVLRVISSFAISSLRERELVTLLCHVTVCILFLCLTVPWVSLKFMIAALPVHTHIFLVLTCGLMSRL